MLFAQRTAPGTGVWVHAPGTGAHDAALGGFTGGEGFRSVSAGCCKRGRGCPGTPPLLEVEEVFQGEGRGRELPSVPGGERGQRGLKATLGVA